MIRRVLLLLLALIPAAYAQSVGTLNLSGPSTGGQQITPATLNAAVNAALAKKADAASPTFTGTITAPSVAITGGTISGADVSGANVTPSDTGTPASLATAIGARLPLSGGTLTGALTVPGVTNTGSETVAGTLTVGGNPLRTYLTTAQALWVTAAGSDANNCSTFALGCATVQRAVNVAMTKFDNATQTVVIQLQSGVTYTGAITITGPAPGSGVLWIQGSGGQATLTANNANLLTAENAANVYIGNAILQTTGTSGGACIDTQSGAQVAIQSGTTFGNCVASQMDASGWSNIIATAGYTITGSAASHLHAHSGGRIALDSQTITCVGSPAFSQYFIGVGELGLVTTIGTTFSGCGTVTGPRFTINHNGAIRTNTGNLTLFPGNAAGTVIDGGTYDGYEADIRIITSGSADTANSSDRYLVWQSASGTAKAETLLACNNTGPWQPIIVKDAQGDAATNNIVISAPSSTIDGSASYTINTAHGHVSLQCDGVSNYMVQ